MAQPLSGQLPLTLGSEVAGRSSWQPLRSLSLLHTGVASFVDEAALLLGQLTALQLVHAAALPEDHRLLGSGGAASNRATPRAAALQLGGQLWRQYDGLLPAATLRHLELAGPFRFDGRFPPEHLEAPVSLANALVSCTQLTYLCLRRLAAVGSALQWIHHVGVTALPNQKELHLIKCRLGEAHIPPLACPA